jgi:hypothetical protein
MYGAPSLWERVEVNVGFWKDKSRNNLEACLRMNEIGGTDGGWKDRRRLEDVETGNKRERAPPRCTKWYNVAVYGANVT